MLSPLLSPHIFCLCFFGALARFLCRVLAYCILQYLYMMKHVRYCRVILRPPALLPEKLTVTEFIFFIIIIIIPNMRWSSCWFPQRKQFSSHYKSFDVSSYNMYIKFSSARSINNNGRQAAALRFIIFLLQRYKGTSTLQLCIQLTVLSLCVSFISVRHQNRNNFFVFERRR